MYLVQHALGTITKLGLSLAILAGTLFVGHWVVSGVREQPASNTRTETSDRPTDAPFESKRHSSLSNESSTRVDKKEVPPAVRDRFRNWSCSGVRSSDIHSASLGGQTYYYQPGVATVRANDLYSRLRNDVLNRFKNSHDADSKKRKEGRGHHSANELTLPIISPGEKRAIFGVLHVRGMDDQNKEGVQIGHTVMTNVFRSEDGGRPSVITLVFPEGFHLGENETNTFVNNSSEPDIPVPSKTSRLASMQQNSRRERRDITVLRSSLSLQNIRDFYKSTLPDAGWNEISGKSNLSRFFTRKTVVFKKNKAFCTILAEVESGIEWGNIIVVILQKKRV